MSDDTELKRLHQRATQAEAALAELRRRHTLLELRNLELSGIVDALSRRGRLEHPLAPERSETSDDALRTEPTEQDAAE